MEDEFRIDFGKYIMTLVRQWQIVLGSAVLFGGLAILLSIGYRMISPAFDAQVLIASPRMESTVNFGSAITSTSAEDLAKQAQNGAQYFYDQKARLQSYVALATNVAVAESVLKELKPTLSEKQIKDLTTSFLLRQVSARLIPNTDTISISFRYNDPQLAADIANAYGKAYVEQINAVFNGNAGGASYLAIQQQTDQSKVDYETAQTALTDYIGQNRVEEYNRQIVELTTVVTNLRAARSTSVNTIINERVDADQKVITELFSSQAANQLLALQQDQEARRQLVTSFMNALSTAQQDVFNQQIQDRIEQLNKAYADRRRAQLLLDNTITMRDAVKSGGDSAAASNSLALTLLKAQIYAAFEGTNTLQIQNLPESWGTSISSVKAQGMLADLDAVVTSLGNRISELNTFIDTLSKQLLNGEDYKYIDNSLQATGALADVIKARYPELFQQGTLSTLSLDAAQNGNQLQSEALTRSLDLLQLKGLTDVLNFNTQDTAMEKKIVDLEQQIRDLQSLISQENAKTNDLTRVRDLAWESYKALATKQTELSVASQTTGVEVVLASPATPPDQSAIKLSLNAGIAVALGLILGLLVVYAYEFWQNYTHRPIQVLHFPFPRFSHKKGSKV